MKALDDVRRKVWWTLELCPRWAHNEHEAAVLGGGEILFKLRVHARDSEGNPTRVSLLRNFPPQEIAREHRTPPVDYWGDADCKHALATVLRMDYVPEGLEFSFDDVVAALDIIAEATMQHTLRLTIGWCVPLATA